MLEIDDDHYAALVAHAKAGYPNEACALLAGRDGSVERVYALPNAEASPTFYVVEPKAQLRAMTAMDDLGLDLVGIFHSHVADDALDREVAKSTDVKLTYDPGTTFQYSNRNYTMLGLLIKVVSGQSYEDYVQEHVLQPLGMQQSLNNLDYAKNHGLTTGHQYWFNRPVPGGGLLENRATTPTGLLTASVEDMSTWLIVHLNHGVYHGTRVLSAS